jgi:hypothetical protein
MTERLPPVHGKSSAWDRIVIDGDSIGGVGPEPHITVKVSGFVGRKIDVQKTDGEDDGTLADKGIDSSTPTIEIVALPGENENGDAYRDLVWSVLKKHDPTRPGFTATAVSVVYPSLNACGINDIVIRKIHLPEPIGGGMLRFRIECLKWSEKPEEKTEEETTTATEEVQKGLSDDGTKWTIRDGENPSLVAEALTEDATRYTELFSANPQKPTEAVSYGRNFKVFSTGEVLNLPESWHKEPGTVIGLLTTSSGASGATITTPAEAEEEEAAAADSSLAHEAGNVIGRGLAWFSSALGGGKQRETTQRDKDTWGTPPADTSNTETAGESWAD